VPADALSRPGVERLLWSRDPLDYAALACAQALGVHGAWPCHSPMSRALQHRVSDAFVERRFAVGEVLTFGEEVEAR